MSHFVPYLTAATANPFSRRHHCTRSPALPVSHEWRGAVRPTTQTALELRQQLEIVEQRASALEKRLLASMHELEDRELETQHRLARALEFRDSGTSAFLERMAQVARLVAEQLGLSEDDACLIETAAPLHDAGKIAIPDSVLLKPGPLTEEEVSVMRQHPKIGYELLSGSRNRFIQAGAIIALRHHERYNGSGYPDGLVGDAIPLEARIVAVADVFDALISRRPYKDAWEVDTAFAYLHSERGRHFDPCCVDALTRNRKLVDDVCERFSKGASRCDVVQLAATKDENCSDSQGVLRRPAPHASTATPPP